MADRIVLAHGGGGAKMRELIERRFLPAYGGEALAALGDGAVLEGRPGRIAFATDSFVVRPYVFPGGDIGELAVNGTVNDLAMCGARPAFLSVGMILEEGLPLADLDRIAASIARAARRAGVEIATGDTKVVERGKGDGIYVNTSGIGWIPEGVELGPARIRAGDAVIVSGPIGEHGIAVLSVREGIAFGTEVRSDTMPLADAAQALLEEPGAVRMMRDPTRGGLSAALNEIARAARLGIRIAEGSVPVSEGVRAACEILGLDPFAIACEGRLLAIVEGARADPLLDRLRRIPGCEGATAIGRVVEDRRGLVTVSTPYGGERVLDLASGEPLPRIC